MTTTISNNDHALQGLVSATLTGRTDERLSTKVVDIITARVGGLETADWMSVLCAALGVPRQHWHLFTRWADDPATPKTLDELYAYIDVMVAERCWKPADDLLSDLIRVEVDGDELTADELRMLVSGLLTSKSTLA
jgi:cytochrome P450